MPRESPRVTHRYKHININGQGLRCNVTETAIYKHMQYGPAELQSIVEEIRVMYLPFITVVGLLAVFTVTLGAPVNQTVGISWNEVTEGSLKLNELAKRLLTEVSGLSSVFSIANGRVMIKLN